MNRHIVAVYGSLRQGLHNHRLLQAIDVEYLGKGLTNNTALLYNLGAFPAITQPTLNRGAEKIVVEVYAVGEQTFKSLDRLEGYPDFYDREQVGVTLDNGDTHEAWVYFLHNERGVVIAANDWKAYKEG